MHIRRAQPNDLPAFVALQVEGWKQAYASILPASYLDSEFSQENQLFWEGRFSRTASNQFLAVVEHQNTVIAAICAFGALSPGGEACIEHLYVSGRHQRAGVGHALLKHAAHWCAVEFDSTSLCLSVVRDNRSAVAFYMKNGAQVRGTDVWHPTCGGAIVELDLHWPSIRALRYA